MFSADISFSSVFDEQPHFPDINLEMVDSLTFDFFDKEFMVYPLSLAIPIIILFTFEARTLPISSPDLPKVIDRCSMAFARDSAGMGLLPFINELKLLILIPIFRHNVVWFIPRNIIQWLISLLICIHLSVIFLDSVLCHREEGFIVIHAHVFSVKHESRDTSRSAAHKRVKDGV